MKPTVFYVEKEPAPELHAHILQHLPRMQHWYEWQNCELVYLPLHELESVRWESIHEYLAYQFPVLNRPEFREVLGTLREPAHMLINRLLVQTGLQNTDGKAFLLYTDQQLQGNNDPYKVLASYIRGSITVEGFFRKGFERLWEITTPGWLPESSSTEISEACLEADATVNFHKHHLNRSSDLEIFREADESIPILSEEVSTQIAALLQTGDRSQILDVLVHLLNNLNPYLKATPAAVLRMLEKHWAEYAVAGKSSRILVDKHCKLFLTDFGNTEIVMRPLPKTLYLFYLNHPEGIAFPYLSDHRQELDQIYAKITNSSNPEEIRRSINNLVDPRENSIHENCSRIKEAFIRVMNISIAQPYLVSGPRGGIKRINLDRSLVTWEPAATSLSGIG